MVKISLKHKLVLFVSVVTSVILGSQIVVAQDDPIKIGIAVAQTSNVALLGQEQVIGAEIAEAYFNEQGGINGRPIELVFQDTAGDEAGAINAFQTLLQDDVIGIVGPTLSQQAFASDPFAEEAKVPVLAPSNTAKGIPQIGEYISRVSSPVAVVAPNAVRAALELDPSIERVAVFYAQDDAFATSETGTFQETVKALDLTLLEPVQTHSKADTDFSTQITNALAGDPQLVIVSGLAADGGNLVRQLRELGYTGLIIGGNGLNTANVFPVCQIYCDGVIIAQAYSYSFESEVNNTFRELYKAEQGKEPPQFSAQAFAGVQVFVESLVQLDNEQGLASLDLATIRTEVNNIILSGREYDTPLGVISFTDEGEINQASFYVAQIDMADDGASGAFIFLDYESPMMDATPEATPGS
jgi:branched-chain amino acid transport system substrate-binding protein